ncbi:uncharacterized protein LOC132608243 [Lycium barbarum]|uniref:uncharacterized protein LOC132608243 n=1 Tax=Lycium barbarum TaxID=112863 RepID=UPI00293F3C2E|nr:uncharacterized protein LOC132608243 [Lycium barbarum]
MTGFHGLFKKNVLNRFGFSDDWNDLIWRSISNVWYSIIINGTRHGFFTSSQGLKQGDPISPSLFIIAAEVLSRSLNNLLDNQNFTHFSVYKNDPQITHLAYADDIVIFSSGNSKSIKLVMQIIKKYEAVSGQMGKNKYHWTSWEKLCFPKNKAGIGIRGMNDISNTLTMKRWWHFRTNINVTSSFLGRLMKEIVVSSGIIGQKYNYKKKVKDFVDNNTWNAQKLYNTLPSDIALHIISIALGQKEKKNYAIWNMTDDGHFSNGTAWKLIRKNRQTNDILNNIWHKSIPFKQSFMCWRIFFGRVPINKVLITTNSQSQIDCICCLIPKNETVQHVFVEGKVADYMWKAMGNPLGITHHHIPLRGLLNEWWKKKTMNKVHKLVLQAVPIIVCWEIWKAWSACKYGDNDSFYLYNMVTQCWNKPQAGSIKINTDGSFDKRNGKAGIGGVVRNENGDFIFAFSIPVQARSSNQAEAIAARFGVDWCIQHGHSNIQLELDSLLVTNMLIQKGTNNLKLKETISCTAKMLSNHAAQVSHCYREANRVADFLAKMSTSSGNRTLYHSLHDLPREAKGLLQLDNWQIPTFRRKYEKCNFFVS